MKRNHVTGGRSTNRAVTLTCRSANENGACNVSNPPVQRRDLFSTHAAIYNTFNVQRHLISRRTLRQFRAAAMERLQEVTAAA